MALRQMSTTILDLPHPTLLVAGAGAILCGPALGVMTTRDEVLEFVGEAYAAAKTDNRTRANCVLFAAVLHENPDVEQIVFARDLTMPDGGRAMGTIRHAIAEADGTKIVGDIGTGTVKVENLSTGESVSFSPDAVMDLLRTHPNPESAIRTELAKTLGPHGIDVHSVSWFATEHWRQTTAATGQTVSFVTVLTQEAEAGLLHPLLVRNAQLAGVPDVDDESDSVSWGGGSLQGVIDGKFVGYPIGTKTVGPIVNATGADFGAAVAATVAIMRKH